jgi:acyl-CoA reductase-like NAD-dependent aldehyde dehydrogenase
MTEHAGIDGISFTGSVRPVRRFWRLVIQPQTVTLELVERPAIVLDDVDRGCAEAPGSL